MLKKQVFTCSILMAIAVSCSPVISTPQGETYDVDIELEERRIDSGEHYSENEIRPQAQQDRGLKRDARAC